jgi:hypothetical protein
MLDKLPKFVPPWYKEARLKKGRAKAATSANQTTSNSKYAPAEEVERVYRWVYEHFDSSNPIHRLAMVAAFILAKMNPTYTVALPQDLPSQANPTQARIHFDRSSWSTTRRPLTEEQTATAFAVLAISILDTDCPLRKRLDNDQSKRGLSSDWQKVHGEPRRVCLTNKLNMMFSGNHGVVPMVLYRMRLLTCRDKMVFRNPMFGVHFKPLTDQEYEARWRILEDELTDAQGTFSIFNTVTEFVGSYAYSLGRRDRFTTPTQIQLSQSAQIPGLTNNRFKRLRVAENDDGDGDDNDSEPEAQRQRR